MASGDDIADVNEVEASGWGDLPEELTPNTTGVFGECSASSGWNSGTSSSLPHRWTSGSTINWNVDEGEESAQMDNSTPNQGGVSNTAFVRQIPTDQYESHTKQYTATAVDQLIHSPQYQRYHTRCQLCWCVWSEMQCRASCCECGGFAMQRPCPVCAGQCGQVWTRDVDLSHSRHEAHWDGQCGLPEAQRLAYLQQTLGGEGVTENDLVEGLEELNTG